jgi:hypothetical protein
VLTPAEQADREPWLHEARAALGEAAYESALAEGRNMTQEEAVAYGLRLSECL